MPTVPAGPGLQLHYYDDDFTRPWRESPTSTPEQQRYMAEQIPNCRLEVYPSLGHGINRLRPEWCVQRVREFLALRASE